MKHVKCGHIPNEDTFQMRIHFKCVYIPIVDTELGKLFFARPGRHERKYAKPLRSYAVKGDRQAGKQAGQWAGREAGRPGGREARRQAGREARRQAGREAGR